ncbi:MAG: phage tail protein, partial [Bilophila wadsworthia]
MKIFSIRLVAFVFVLGLGIVQPGFCLDSTGFNPATVSVQSVGSSIPVGTVITWPSSSWPPDADNWLECNGQAINSTVYPELVALIGWNVPNYQGVFLRGYGGQTSYHYGAVGHWSAGLGELQGDGIREISASFSTGGQHGIGGASGSFGVTGGQGYDWKYGGTGNTYWGGIDFYASRVTPVVGE